MLRSVSLSVFAFVVCILGSARAQQPALRFIPLAPCRIADTRNAAGPFGGPSIAAKSSRDFVIPNSSCGIPSTAAAYSLNVTVIPWGILGYVTVWPTGQPQPFVSTVNSLDGRVKANAAIVPEGTGGAISVYATDTTDVVLDINGFFVPASQDSTALAFFPLTPCRVADTRPGSGFTGTLGPPFLQPDNLQGRRFDVLSSKCNIPKDGSAKAYSLNVTASPHGSLGFLTAWPTGLPWPDVSTLNAPTGTLTANAAIVPAGPDGAILVTITDNADVIIDINGYFAAGAGLSLYTLPPCRVMDTRDNGIGLFSDKINPPVDTTDSFCGVPPNGQAVVLNATVQPAQPLGFLTLWPAGQPQPLVSTLNALDGQITSNMAIVPTSSGVIDAFAKGSTQLLFDTSGYFLSGTGPAPIGPTDKFAYQVNVNCSDTNIIGCVSLYSIDGRNGILTFNGSASVGSGSSAMAVDPSGKFAYVANPASGDVSMYTINPETGGLAPNNCAIGGINTVPAGSSPTLIAAHPTGKFAYVANAAGISVYTINSTGCLSVPRQASPGGDTNSIGFHPSGNFAYVADSTFGEVVAFAVNSNGTLTIIGSLPINFPSAMVAHPSGKFAYAVNSGANEVYVFGIDAAGKLTTPTCTASTRSSPSSVGIDPLGTFAYVSNSGANNITAYAIDSISGCLTEKGTQDAVPALDSLTVEHSGRFVYAVSESDLSCVFATPIGSGVSISAYKIDRTTGLLKLPGEKTCAGHVFIGTPPRTVVVTSGPIP